MPLSFFYFIFQHLSTKIQYDECIWKKFPQPQIVSKKKRKENIYQRGSRFTKVTFTLRKATSCISRNESFWTQDVALNNLMYPDNFSSIVGMSRQLHCIVMRVCVIHVPWITSVNKFHRQMYDRVKMSRVQRSSLANRKQALRSSGLLHFYPKLARHVHTHRNYDQCLEPSKVLVLKWITTAFKLLAVVTQCYLLALQTVYRLLFWDYFTCT